MRPDEHKKKKNADYKKKHGIASSKNLTKNEGKEGKGSQKETVKKDAVKVENTPTVCEQKPRKFSRRKINSNWDRYEDPDSPDEDSPSLGVQQRGADFATLVQEAGTSHSQFRFQDEKEWEDNENDTLAPQAILQINFQDLSETLKSIPLHQRLELHEMEVNLNLQSSSTTMHNTARHKASENTSTINKDTSSLAPTPTLPTSMHTSNDETATLNLNFSPSSNKMDSNKQNGISPTQETRGISSVRNNFAQKGEEAAKVKESKKLSFKAERKSTGISPKDNVSVITDEDEFEDELDRLLSLDSKQIDKQLKQTLNKNEAKSTQLSVEDLEANTSMLNMQENLSETKETTDKSVAKKEDLEDWLDSVLG